MTNSEYRTHPAISRSDLFKIKKSPAHFRYEMGNPQAKTSALIFGAAFHKYVLEPDGFYDEFVIAPSIDRRTKAGKEQFEAFQTDTEGKDIITLDEMFTIKGMSESIKSNKYAMVALGGEHERPFFWKDDLTGEECKCRPDALTLRGTVNIITDLKSCTDASTDAFMRDCIKYGYDVQDAMYTEGVEHNTGVKCAFVFVAVEKTPPYAVNVLQADDLFYRRGYDTYRELLGIYHSCKETGNWYSYNGFSGIINNLSLPAWMAKDFQ